MRLELALSTDYTHVRLPAYLVRAWLGWLAEARAAAETWLDEHEPGPDNQTCRCGGVDVCAACSAAALIRRMAWLPPRPPQTPLDDLDEDFTEGEEKQDGI